MSPVTAGIRAVADREPSLETMRSRIYDPVLYPSQPNLIGDLRADAMRLLDLLERADRLNGILRRKFRQRMREWREHAPEYSYGEDDVEQFLIEAEREALEPDEETLRREVLVALESQPHSSDERR